MYRASRISSRRLKASLGIGLGLQAGFAGVWVDMDEILTK
jgi:hypothetical protein